MSNRGLLFINDGDFSRSDGKQNISREVVPALAQMKESFQSRPLITPFSIIFTLLGSRSKHMGREQTVIMIRQGAPHVHCHLCGVSNSPSTLGCNLPHRHGCEEAIASVHGVYICIPIFMLFGIGGYCYRLIIGNTCPTEMTL